MGLIFNEKEIDIVYQKWIRLGWNATGQLWQDEIDIEALIVETTKVARQDGRLFKCLLTWVRDYNDLINKKRLLRIMENADLAVLGAVFEIAIEQGADTNFNTIILKYKPKKPFEVLFTGMEEVFTFIEQEKNTGLKIYKKWGLYCTLLEFYDDAKKTREWVLKQNPELALRALFGANLRAEIIFCLLHQTNLAIKNIAQRIGYAYGPVHKEIANMVKSGFIDQVEGQWYSLNLSSKSKRLVDALLV